jgi:hypothetical protein
VKLFPHIQLVQIDSCQQVIRGLINGYEDAEVEIFFDGENFKQVNANGVYIGTLPEDRAKDITPLVEKGEIFCAKIIEVQLDQSDGTTLVPYINILTWESGDGHGQ